MDSWLLAQPKGYGEGQRHERKGEPSGDGYDASIGEFDGNPGQRPQEHGGVGEIAASEVHPILRSGGRGVCASRLRRPRR